MKEIEEKLQQLRASVRQTVELASRPALFWSGGLDSTLLLFLAREVSSEIALMQLRSSWSEEQKAFSDSLIRDLGLKVFVYAPKDRFFVPGEGESIVLVEDYDVAGFNLPLIRDVVHADETCALDAARLPLTPSFGFPFDTALVGWRRDDSHFAIGDYEFEEEVWFGVTRVVAPLLEYGREEIEAFCRLLNVPASEFYAGGDALLDTGNYAACARCLISEGEVFCPKAERSIPGARWAKAEALRAFRARFS